MHEEIHVEIFPGELYIQSSKWPLSNQEGK